MSGQAIFEIYLSNQWAFVPAIVVFVIGITLCWFGGLVAALTALGNKRWLWGIFTIILGPITGLPYALLFKEAEYAKSLMVKGLVILGVSVIIAGIGWFFV